MGKSRIYSNNAVIQVVQADGTAIDVGEIESCTAKSLDELKTNQGLGNKDIASQAVFKGWELTFEGGKVDWRLAELLHGQDLQITAGGRSPYFKVRQTIRCYDGTIEEFEYPQVTIHGYELHMPNQDLLSESFSGFCGMARVKTPTATTTSQNTVLNALFAAMKEESPKSYLSAT